MQNNFNPDCITSEINAAYAEFISFDANHHDDTRRNGKQKNKKWMSREKRSFFLDSSSSKPLARTDSKENPPKRFRSSQTTSGRILKKMICLFDFLNDSFRNSR